MEPTTEMVTTDTTDATTEDYFTEYPVDYCPEGYHVNEFGECEGKKAISFCLTYRPLFFLVIVL